MSTENAARFFQMVEDDPELARKLVGGETSAAEVFKRTLAEAKQRGLEFSPGEAHEVLRARMSALTAKDKAATADGEIPDADLENIAGGTNAVTYFTIANTIMAGAGQAMQAGTDPGMNFNPSTFP